MKIPAYQKRHGASPKRAKKSGQRRVKNAAARHAGRELRIKQRNKHKCEDHQRPMHSAADIQYEVAGRQSAACYGGIGLASAVARQSALVDVINRYVE